MINVMGKAAKNYNVIGNIDKHYKFDSVLYQLSMKNV
jgi:hypothetical protein